MRKSIISLVVVMAILFIGYGTFSCREQEKDQFGTSLFEETRVAGIEKIDEALSEAEDPNEVLEAEVSDYQTVDVVNVASISESKKKILRLKVFFFNDKLQSPGQVDCAAVHPVTREVPFTLGVARAALEELIRGPTEEEKKGYVSAVNPKTRIKRLVVKEGITEVDFSKEIDIGGAGSCGAEMIYAQIEATLGQFPTVKRVIISVEGRIEGILQL